MTRAAVRNGWKTEDGGRHGLYWALKGAALDGERCGFNVSRLKEVLLATRDLANSGFDRDTIRFLRQLGYAWLDARDPKAREVIRKAIADYIPTLNMEKANTLTGASIEVPS